MLRRRGLLVGLGLLAAPAIIRTPGLLMPIKPVHLMSAEDAVARLMRGLDAQDNLFHSEWRRYRYEKLVEITPPGFRSIQVWSGDVPA